MNKIAIAVHGGAGPDSEFVQQHVKEYNQGITKALNEGYAVLEKGGSAIDAVEAAVMCLEDNPLFNAGRGSALNEKGEVVMDASVMKGDDLDIGAVCLIKNVKNPIKLARAVMEKTPHAFLGSTGAMLFAEELGLEMMPDSYFITEHAFSQYKEALEEGGKSLTDVLRKKPSRLDTVGAIAVDINGNVAAATSTGGTENKMLGRIGDSPVIGSGCYANNNTCAVSTTGDGEVIIQHVAAFHLNCIMQYKNLGLKEAADFLMQQTLKDIKGDIGLIAIDKDGNISINYNSERMHRGYKRGGELFVASYSN